MFPLELGGYIRLPLNDRSHTQKSGKVVLRTKMPPKVQSGPHVRFTGPRVRVPINGGSLTCVCIFKMCKSSQEIVK